jgi:membrane protease YdiL (CAAX protease family)
VRPQLPLSRHTPLDLCFTNRALLLSTFMDLVSTENVHSPTRIPVALSRGALSLQAAALAILPVGLTAPFAMAYARLRTPTEPTPADYVAANFAVGWLGLWLELALFWMFIARREDRRDAFALRSRDVAVDLTWGAALGALWVIVYGILGAPHFSAMFSFDAAKLASVPLSVTAGITEELLCRGLLIDSAARAGYGTRSRLAISAAVFGLSHLLWGPGAMLVTALLGGTLAASRLHRGSVLPAIVAHVLLNLCIEPGLMRLALAAAG